MATKDHKGQNYQQETSSGGVRAAHPTGSAAGADGRPRAQVSYEGQDEFSAMSLDPSRRRGPPVNLGPASPTNRSEVQVDEMKPRKRGMINFLRKIFAG